MAGISDVSFRSKTIDPDLFPLSSAKKKGGFGLEISQDFFDGGPRSGLRSAARDLEARISRRFSSETPDVCRGAIWLRDRQGEIAGNCFRAVEMEIS